EDSCIRIVKMLWAKGFSDVTLNYGKYNEEASWKGEV
ncbi:MAG: hypothetical protein XD80_1574, partial [Synergistales bacterium 53_16]